MAQEAVVAGAHLQETRNLRNPHDPLEDLGAAVQGEVSVQSHFLLH